MSFSIYAVLAFIPWFVLGHRIYHRSLFGRLRSSDKGVALNRVTTDLSTIDVTLVLLLLVIEAVKRLLGFGPSKAPSEASSPKTDPSKYNAKELPVVWVSMLLQVRDADIEQYRLAAGLPMTSHTPSAVSDVSENNAHLALFLSAISNPVLLLLLARTKCPINPLGAVNVRNQIKLINLELCRRVVNDTRTVGTTSSSKTSQGSPKVTVYASPLPKTRRVKRGTEVDVSAVIRFQEHDSAETVEIFEQIFTVLEFGKSAPSHSSKDEAGHVATKVPKRTGQLIDASKKDLKVPPQLATYFNIKQDEPIQWARLCKDYNPIHTSSVAAKLFGFRSKIAHGNHVVTRAITSLTQSKGQKFLDFCHRRSGKGLQMLIEFKRPVLVPAEVGVRAAGLMLDSDKANTQQVTFEVFKGEKVHIEVQAEPAPEVNLLTA